MAPRVRTYPLPKHLRASLGCEEVTIDQIEDLAASSLQRESRWAYRTLQRENRKVLHPVLSGLDELPRGLVARGAEDDLAIEALVAKCGKWKGEWDKDWEFSVPKVEEAPDVHGATMDAWELDADGMYADPDSDYDNPVDYYDSWADSSYGLEDELAPACPVCGELKTEEICAECGRHHPTGQMTVQLTEEDIAAIIRAYLQGADVVLLRPYAPAARTDIAVQAAAETGVVLPENAVAIAVVDELDKAAVLELLAVAPGPTVYVRAKKTWEPSDEWRDKLSSISPPPVVELDDVTLGSVIAQIDQLEDGDADEEEVDEEGQPEGAQGMQSSGQGREALTTLDRVAADSQDAALAFTLLAASKAASKVKNKVTGAERLRQYWGYGEGAAKIRWGTKGDWTRCVRHLKKYLGPRAKGYCNLMHARVTGTWPNGKGANKIPNPAVSAEAVAKQFAK